MRAVVGSAKSLTKSKPVSNNQSSDQFQKCCESMRPDFRHSPDFPVSMAAAVGTASPAMRRALPVSFAK